MDEATSTHPGGGPDDRRARRVRSALREALFEIAPVGLMFVNELGECERVNETFCEITGRRPDEVYGHAYLTVLHPDDHALMMTHWRASVARHERTGGDVRFVRPDDSIAPVSVQIAPLLVDNDVVGYLVTVVDMSERYEHDRQLRDSETFLRAINDRAPIGICMIDPLGTALNANPRLVEILGVDPTGRNLTEFVVDEDLDHAVTTSMEAVAAGRVDYDFSVRFFRPDGSLRTSHVHAHALLDDDGDLSNSVIAVIDTTDEVEARQRSERYAELLAALTDFVALCDEAGRITFLNRVAEIHGDALSPKAGSRRLADFFDAASRGRLAAEAWPEVIAHGFWQGELTLAGPRGISVPASVSLAVHRHDEGDRSVSVVARDITDFKNAQRALEVQATHDPLTGLPNRALLFDRVAHAIERGTREVSNVVLMFVDLDGFKRVNDTHGHDAGDEVLRGVATRLLDVVRLGDTVARIGGDEFVVLCESLPDTEVTFSIASRIVERLSEPFGVGAELARIGASVGVAFGDASATVAGLVKRADLAVYEAKRMGRGCVVTHDLTGMLRRVS